MMNEHKFGLNLKTVLLLLLGSLAFVAVSVLLMMDYSSGIDNKGFALAMAFVALGIGFNYSHTKIAQYEKDDKARATTKKIMTILIILLMISLLLQGPALLGFAFFGYCGLLLLVALLTNRYPIIINSKSIKIKTMDGVLYNLQWPEVEDVVLMGEYIVVKAKDVSKLRAGFFGKLNINYLGSPIYFYTKLLKAKPESIVKQANAFLNA